MLHLIGPVGVKNVLSEYMVLGSVAYTYTSYGPYSTLPGERWFPHYVERVAWELYFTPGEKLSVFGSGGFWIPVGYDNTAEGMAALEEIIARAGDPTVRINTLRFTKTI